MACLPCICAVSCAQLSFALEPDNGLCNTHDEYASESSLSMSRLLCRLKASAVQVWQVDGVWLKHSSSRPTPPWSLGALRTRTAEVGSVKSTLEKHFVEKFSTSSSSVSLSFIFLAIMDTLPLRQPLLTLRSGPCQYWLDLSTNSHSLGGHRVCKCLRRHPIPRLLATLLPAELSL